MIELKEIHFRYESHGPDVLKGINLYVPDGEFLALIGPNGSGKSTLAEVMSGLLPPSGGDVHVDGINSKENPWELRKKVGIVFQNPEHQFFHSTVEEDVAFGPENLGLNPIEVKRRVKRALQLTGMEGYEKWSPSKLSAGQKQSVAIAGILAMEPKYLILDEPTSLLDPVGKMRIFRIVQQLHKTQGCTIIWITQDMEEAAKAQRVVVIEGGKILRDGKPAEIFSQMEFLEGIGLIVPDIIRLKELLKRNGMIEIWDTVESLLNCTYLDEIREKMD